MDSEITVTFKIPIERISDPDVKDVLDRIEALKNPKQPKAHPSSNVGLETLIPTLLGGLGNILNSKQDNGLETLIPTLLGGLGNILNSKPREQNRDQEKVREQVSLDKILEESLKDLFQVKEEPKPINLGWLLKILTNRNSSDIFALENIVNKILTSDTLSERVSSKEKESILVFHDEIAKYISQHDLSKYVTIIDMMFQKYFCVDDETAKITNILTSILQFITVIKSRNSSGEEDDLISTAKEVANTLMTSWLS